MERPRAIPIKGAQIGRTTKSGSVLLQFEDYPVFAMSVQSAKEMIESLQHEVDILEGRKPNNLQSGT